MPISPIKLDRLIEEATVDAYGGEEQRGALYTVIEERLALPFRTKLLGVEVTVKRVDMNAAGEVVAICTRGRTRQAVTLVDLPLLVPPPQGSEWIAAYRRWARNAAR